MRKLLLLFIIAITASGLSRAQSVYKYHFWGNLHEMTTGPDLTAVCADSFVTDTFPAFALSRPVYYFNQGCGFNFDDAADFLMTGSYTIEMYAALDSVISYRKIIDYKNQNDDGGLYITDSSLDFYSILNTLVPIYRENKYALTTISRNAANQRVRLFVNGSYLGSFTDAAGDAFYNAYKLLRFFQNDTLNGTNEVSAGRIAYLAIYNGERDSLAIHNDYDSLGFELASTSVKNVNYNNSIRMWPNPVENTLHVSATQAYPYIIFDLAGRNLVNGTLTKGENNIAVDNLAEGLYFIRLQGDNSLGVYKFIKR